MFKGTSTVYRMATDETENTEIQRFIPVTVRMIIMH